jgi:hypothetical protein
MSTDPLALAQAHLQVLNDLTAIAMEMARAVKDQVGGSGRCRDAA